ncbi:hypothetical protein ACIBBB_28345 [Streptomyces sp. NPDC051217]|uniref:hypothetical protein n=1 Tax=Streptomyces sp. NPDC051217 TaxID=3365644 RepID=UPI00378FA342
MTAGGRRRLRAAALCALLLALTACGTAPGPGPAAYEAARHATSSDAPPAVEPPRPEPSAPRPTPPPTPLSPRTTPGLPSAPRIPSRPPGTTAPGAPARPTVGPSTPKSPSAKPSGKPSTTARPTGTTLRIGSWSARIVRGGQEAVDACRDAVQWAGPDLGTEDGYAMRTAVVVGHDFCGFGQLATLAIGTVVTVETPREVLRYRVYARHLTPGRGAPAHGLYWGDLTLQSCVGPDTGFTYLERL